jgi:thiol-disulfide isomerase/thioredoxin
MIKNPIVFFVAIVFIVFSIWYFQSTFSHPQSSGNNSPQEITLNPSEPAVCEAAGNCTSTQPHASTTPNLIQQSNATARVLAKKGKYPRAIELAGISGYLNIHDGFRLSEAVGKKVVLVDFWTYSCINCQRTLPYLNAWYQKYKDQGLEIVGVHTPEFEFEKNKANVASAIAKYGIMYPVVQDNDYGTWGAYGNRYWPRKYLIDIDGYIVYDHIGEGGYDETEQKIQELLKERASAMGEQVAVSSDVVHPAGVIGVNDSVARSSETYFGADRNEFLGNGIQAKVGLQAFVLPKTFATGKLYLDGDWNIEAQFAQTKSAQAKVVYRYQGNSVYVVASSPEPVAVTVLRDGVLVPPAAAGEDVVNGKVLVSGSRLYKIIKDNDYGTHTLELIIDKPSVQFYTFTFG